MRPEGLGIGPEGLGIAPEGLGIGPEGLGIGPEGLGIGPKGLGIGPASRLGPPGGSPGASPYFHLEALATGLSSNSSIFSQEPRIH